MNQEHEPLTIIGQRLEDRLYQYLCDEQLDLLIALQEDHRLQHYLQTKIASVSEQMESLLAEQRPHYVIEALCMEELTADLRPSRFAYVRDLLAEEFTADYQRLKDCGILTYELINLVGACEPIFLVYGFGSEAEESRELRPAISGMIGEYIEPAQNSQNQQ